MYFDDDSLHVWERHELLPSWKELLLAQVPEGPTKPIVTAMQKIVARHGDLSILLWQVQELALSLCGKHRPRFHAAYDADAARLTELGGSSWPLTHALREHLDGNDPVTQLTTRLSSCDGEWRALLRLADAGWRPLKTERGSGPDWVVTKDGIELPVEVKTKCPLASAAGRLTRYFIGLGMLPRFGFLREFDFSWYVDDDMTDDVVRGFVELFIDHFDDIVSETRQGKPSLVTIESSEEQRLRLCVRETRSFWLELISGKRRAVLDASAARLADHQFTGGGRARTSHGEVAELPGIGKAFGRLLRPKQSRNRKDETLVMLVWHMPFHAFAYEQECLDAFWKSWCKDHSIVRGALLPVTPAGNLQPFFLTDAAARLDLGSVHA